MRIVKSVLWVILLLYPLYADMATEMQCIGGDSKSCFDLAYAYDEGSNDVQQDKVNAVKFYDLACKQKHARLVTKKPVGFDCVSSKTSNRSVNMGIFLCVTISQN